MKIGEKKKEPRSFEEVIVEGVRRGYLTVDEGKFCMRIGFVSKDLCKKVEEKIKLDPKADIRGNYKIASVQEHMKRFLKIRFLINPYTGN
jgi:hypothetical protein